jgi:hypothetical protein
MTLTASQSAALVSRVKAVYSDLSSASDVVLANLVGRAYQAVVNYLGYVPLSATHTELYDRPSDCRLWLKNINVQTIDFLATETGDVLTCTYTGSDTHARVQVTDTAVVLTSRVGATTTSNSLAFASYVTSDALVTAIGAVSGWSATLLASVPSAYLIRTGPMVAKSATVCVSAWTEYDGQLAIDYPQGEVLFLDPINWGFGQADPRVFVQYTAGLGSVPADIEDAMVRLVKLLNDDTAREAGIQSESEGDYSYSLASTGTGGSFKMEADSILAGLATRANVKL